MKCFKGHPYSISLSAINGGKVKFVPRQRIKEKVIHIFDANKIMKILGNPGLLHPEIDWRFLIKLIFRGF